MPTVLDALGIEVPAGVDGRSLLALAAHGDRSGEGDESYLEALSASLNRGWAPLRGVVAGGLKYVELPIPELYDLREDPREQKNLAASRPADLERLRARLAALRKDERGGGPLTEDAATRDALRALGYVAGGAPPKKERYGVDDDPKRLVDLDERSSEVVRRYQVGDVDGAAALARRLVDERPSMPLAWLQLAFLERARGRQEEALAAARQAIALRPADAETASLLGAYLTEAGRHGEAVALLEPYARRSPPDLDVLTALGMALAGMRRFDDALATFRRAREADPTSALALANEGTVHLMAGDRAAARQAFSAALDVDDGLARAHNGLGVIAAQEGRGEEAIERWRRAAALDPRDHQTLFNLGVALRERGRLEESRRYLEAYLQAAPRALEARDIERVRGWLAEAPRR
jgi:Flp pilus assembly protein TadD